jgi:hypothetical protein
MRSAQEQVSSGHWRNTLRNSSKTGFGNEILYGSHRSVIRGCPKVTYREDLKNYNILIWNGRNKTTQKGM